MRRILFKGKHVHAIEGNEHLDGDWIEGYLADRNYINTGQSEKLIKEDTICQYTEMFCYWDEPEEEFCKKVFEHDLLAVSYEGEEVIAEVMYSGGMYILVSNAFPDGYCPLADYVQCDDDLWIMAEHKGNKFDNPELLEE